MLDNGKTKEKTINTPTLKNCIIAYLDLLGVSTSTLSNNRSKEKLLKLIINFASYNGEYKKNWIDKYKKIFTETPSITTFSDNIIISYPVHKKSFILPLINITSSISWFVSKAIEAGFLVRGGLTVGKLYHRNNVVFGDGLIVAHNLESQLANYPRIIVDSAFIEFFKIIQIPEYLEQDVDGFYYLNYLRDLVDQYAQINGNKRAAQYLDLIQQQINKNIQNLSIEKKVRQLSKWHWFNSYFKKNSEKIKQKYNVLM